MGLSDWKHWAVLLVVVILVFGTKKLKNLGGDLGETIKGFRRAMKEEEQAAPTTETPSAQSSIEEHGKPVNTTQLNEDALKK